MLFQSVVVYWGPNKCYLAHIFHACSIISASIFSGTIIDGRMGTLSREATLSFSFFLLPFLTLLHSERPKLYAIWPF